MNYPTVWIWQLWSFLTKKWTPANNFFQDLRDSARRASDNWQNRNSAGYILGRMAPGAAVALPTAVASSPAAIAALPVTSALWLETAGISTIAYPAVDIWPSIEYQEKLNQQKNANIQAKRLIVNELSRMSNAWEIQTNPTRTQKLIDLYNKLK